jgi:hypothetical protein
MGSGFLYGLLQRLLTNHLIPEKVYSTVLARYCKIVYMNYYYYYYSKDRLDQGDLHPKLEDPILTDGREWNPGLHKRAIQKIEKSNLFSCSFKDRLKNYQMCLLMFKRKDSNSRITRTNVYSPITLFPY